MPGPPPKDPKVRARRNKEPTARTLFDRNPLAPGEVPPMPKKRQVEGEAKRKQWLERSRQHWIEIWTGPVASGLIRSDVARVEIYIDLFDEYLRTRSQEIKRELRLEASELGLGPIPRRRLGWTVEPRIADDRAPPKRAARTGKDPRLQLVGGTQA